MEKSFKLKKALKERHINMIALGGIIGSSYFVGTGYTMNQMGPSCCLAYVLGGFITLLVMSCFTEMILAKPCEGSFINYSKTFISPTVASGVGWSYWFSWVVYVPSECIAGGLLMKHLIPSVPIQVWILSLGLIVSLFNLIHVKLFGELEYILSWIKIILIAGFSILAIAIFFGLIGIDKTEFIGKTYLIDNGGFFARGVGIFLANLVIMISSFQGTEIVGITASETKNAQTTVPKTLKQITIRLLLIYLLPTFLLVLIYPWQDANLEGSVFSAALTMYGLKKIGHLFNILIIAGSISCANSGLYSTIRSMHALSIKGFAPSAFQKVTRHGVPINASLITLAMMWLILILSCTLSPHAVYANLLALTGFAGTVAWIAICAAQYYFRKKYLKKPQELRKPLAYETPLYPYTPLLGIWLQIFCLAVLVLSPALRISFYFGLPSVIIPMLLYKYSIKNRSKNLFP